MLAACQSPRSTWHDDFATPAALAQFEFTDAAAWRHGIDGNGCVELFAASNYRPPHRSPLNLALLRDVELQDFELRVRARQTGREYPHRDLVLVFAHRDAAHFAYAHLASAADDHAHHVMLVDGSDRRPVTTWRNGGVVWGDTWHELELSVRDGVATVRFDGHEVLRGAVPATTGRIGFGSFDDVGCFDDLRVL